MKIGIIGTGRIGSGLGKLWSAKGHQVMFGSRNPSAAKDIVDEVGHGAKVGSIPEAAHWGDAVLLAVPWHAARDTIEAAGSLEGKVLIDCVNPLSEDHAGLTVGHTSSAAEEISGWAPEAKVVKAYNAVFATVIHSSPVFGSQRATIFICGDDAGAKNVVAGLVEDSGFEAVDAGPLDVARSLEPLALLIVRLAYEQKMSMEKAIKLLNR